MNYIYGSFLDKVYGVKKWSTCVLNSACGISELKVVLVMHREVQQRWTRLHSLPAAHGCKLQLAWMKVRARAILHSMHAGTIVGHITSWISVIQRSPFSHLSSRKIMVRNSGEVSLGRSGQSVAELHMPKLLQSNVVLCSAWGEPELRTLITIVILIYHKLALQQYTETV